MKLYEATTREGSKVQFMLGYEYLIEHRKGIFRGIVKSFDEGRNLIEIKLTSTRKTLLLEDQPGEIVWIAPCPMTVVRR